MIKHNKKESRLSEKARKLIDETRCKYSINLEKAVVNLCSVDPSTLNLYDKKKVGREILARLHKMGGYEKERIASQIFNYHPECFRSHDVESMDDDESMDDVESMVLKHYSVEYPMWTNAMEKNYDLRVRFIRENPMEKERYLKKFNDIKNGFPLLYQKIYLEAGEVFKKADSLERAISAYNQALSIEENVDEKNLIIKKLEEVTNLKVERDKKIERIDEKNRFSPFKSDQRIKEGFEAIGKSAKSNTLDYGTHALVLDVPKDISKWPTGPEAFRNSTSRYRIEGIPANLAIYHLVDGKPTLNLLERDGNLLTSNEFRDKVYKGIVDSYLNSSPFFLSKMMEDYVMEAVNNGKSKQFDLTNIRTNNRGEVIADNKLLTSEERRLFLSTMGVENPSEGSIIRFCHRERIEKSLASTPNGIIAYGCWLNTGEKSFIIDCDWVYRAGPFLI